MVPLGFQVGVLPAAALVYVGGFGAGGNQALLVLCATLMVATTGLAFGVLRGLSVRAVLVADGTLAVGANLAMSAMSAMSWPSASVSDRAAEVSWQYYAGCVALATLVRGVPGGLAAVAGGIPLRVTMFVVGGQTSGSGASTGAARTAWSATVSGLGDTLVLVLAMGLAAGVLWLLDRDAERLRAGIRRSLHDTVLQTLEAIALTLPSDGDVEVAPRRLREVRAIAHAEAVALRRELSRRSAMHTPDLVEGLIGLVAELARDGLRVRLDATESAEFENDGLTAKRRAALIAATREALRNVLKHSGTAEALVRVRATACDGDGYGSHAADRDADGLTLTVRDFGVGFDPGAHQPGFGLSESVAGRMREVGGVARIGARPGEGTSVTLWVPVEGAGAVDR